MSSRKNCLLDAAALTGALFQLGLLIAEYGPNSGALILIIAKICDHVKKWFQTSSARIARSGNVNSVGGLTTNLSSLRPTEARSIVFGLHSAGGHLIIGPSDLLARSIPQRPFRRSKAFATFVDDIGSISSSANFSPARIQTPARRTLDVHP